MTNILFDYDGTLHECIKTYEPSFWKAYDYLVQIGKTPSRKPTTDDFYTWIGMTQKDMWAQYAPDVPVETHELCSKLISDEITKITINGQAKLYDGVIETLEYLKQNGYKLNILSNCTEVYINAHREAFGLDKYISNYYTAESYNYIPKHEIFSKIKNDDDEYIMIGDRTHDIEVARKHRIKAYGCLYGYGTIDELKGSQLISKPTDLMKYL